MAAGAELVTTGPAGTCAVPSMAMAEPPPEARHRRRRAADHGYAQALDELDHILVGLEDRAVDVDQLAGGSGGQPSSWRCAASASAARLEVEQVVASLDEADLSFATRSGGRGAVPIQYGETVWRHEEGDDHARGGGQLDLHPCAGGRRATTSSVSGFVQHAVGTGPR